MYRKEKQMYPDVCAWFKRMLEYRFKEAEICVEDTSKKMLSKWLVEKGFHDLFPDYQTYEIEVDVTGVVKKPNETHLGLIECKLGKITLRDLSQLLGYSKVALPLVSIIISPKGISRSMNLLFNIFRRNDVLFYSDNKYIFIGKWNEKRKELDVPSLIPKGGSIL